MTLRAGAVQDSYIHDGRRAGEYLRVKAPGACADGAKVRQPVARALLRTWRAMFSHAQAAVYGTHSPHTECHVPLHSSSTRPRCVATSPV